MTPPEQTDWQPGAGIELLRARAALLQRIRGFFAQRNVLEVETPLLCQATVTDPNIEVPGCDRRWLQTSPEYAMKRLLAAGSGPIYQICKAFRAGEAGARHNPEFSLLEWYRPGFTLAMLMREVAELLNTCLGEDGEAVETISYTGLFQQVLAIDPLNATATELKTLAGSQLHPEGLELDRDGWLDLLMSHRVEPALRDRGRVFVYDYPASQAALARVRPQTAVAERFELYVNGLELANGYLELGDALELEQRFAGDNRRREAAGQQRRSVDTRFLAAMRAGLPDCAGVALGLDRLLMLARDCPTIDEVLSFSWERA